MEALTVVTEVVTILAVLVPSALWARRKLNGVLQAQRQERERARERELALEQSVTHLQAAVDYLQARQDAQNIGLDTIVANLDALGGQLAQLDRSVEALREFTAKGMDLDRERVSYLSKAVEKALEDNIQMSKQSITDSRLTSEQIGVLREWVDMLSDKVTRLLEWVSRDAAATQAPNIEDTPAGDETTR
jgi:DNA repair exonuclease SbcCD ATPase subunit